MKKLTHKTVKSEFDKIGYKLLSTEYKNSNSKLEYICDKGHYGFISWHCFKVGNRCKQCGINNRIEKRKLTYDFVKEQFEKENFILLSTEYINNSSKLNYICSNGHIGAMTYGNFYSGWRCKKCYSGDKHHSWRGGKTISLYDTYAHQINWIEEVRRDPKNNDLLQVKCTNCSKWIIPTSNQVKDRIKSLYGSCRGENHFYCSDECKNLCSVYNQKLYPSNYIKSLNRDVEVQKELAVMVFKRDNYECQRCGNKKYLECHHYESLNQNPIESADIDACVTLCSDCHDSAHKDKGCRRIDLRKERLCR